jgi:hypothetical protein
MDEDVMRELKITADKMLQVGKRLHDVESEVVAARREVDLLRQHVAKLIAQA